MKAKLHFLVSAFVLLCLPVGMRAQTKTHESESPIILKRVLEKVVSKPAVAEISLENPIKYISYDFEDYGLYKGGSSYGTDWALRSPSYGEDCCYAFAADGEASYWSGASTGDLVLKTMITRPITFDAYMKSELQIQWGYRALTKGTPKLVVYIADLEGNRLTAPKEFFDATYTSEEYSKKSPMYTEKISLEKINKNAVVVIEYRGSVGVDESSMMIYGIKLSGTFDANYKDIVPSVSTIKHGRIAIRQQTDGQTYALMTKTFSVKKINVPESVPIKMAGASSPFTLSPATLTDQETEVTLTGKITTAGVHKDEVVIAHNGIERKIPVEVEVIGLPDFKAHSGECDFGTIYSHEEKVASIGITSVNILSGEHIDILLSLEGEGAQYFALGYSDTSYPGNKISLGTWDSYVNIRYLPKEAVGVHKATLVLTYGEKQIKIPLKGESKLKETWEYYKDVITDQEVTGVGEFRYLAPVYDLLDANPTSLSQKPFKAIYFRTKDYSSGCFANGESRAKVDAPSPSLRKHFSFKVSKREAEAAAKAVKYALVSPAIDLSTAAGKEFSFLHQDVLIESGAKMIVDLIDARGEVLKNLGEVTLSEKTTPEWVKVAYSIPQGLTKPVGFVQISFEAEDSNRGGVAVYLDDFVLETVQDASFTLPVSDVFFGEVPSVSFARKKIIPVLKNIPENDEVIIYSRVLSGEESAFVTTPQFNSTVSAKDLKEFSVKFINQNLGMHASTLSFVWRDQVVELPLSGYIRKSSEEDYFASLSEENPIDRFDEPIRSSQDVAALSELRNWTFINTRGTTAFQSTYLDATNYGLYLQTSPFWAEKGITTYLVSPAIDLEKAAGSKFVMTYFLKEFSTQFPFTTSVLIIDRKGHTLATLGTIDNAAVDIPAPKDFEYIMPELEGVGFIAIKGDIAPIAQSGWEYTTKAVIDALKLEGKAPSILANPKSLDFGLLEGNSEAPVSKTLNVALSFVGITDPVKIAIKGEQAEHFTVPVSEVSDPVKRVQIPVTVQASASGSYTAELELKSGDVVTIVPLKARAAITAYKPEISVGIAEGGLDFGVVYATAPAAATATRKLVVRTANLKNGVAVTVEGAQATSFVANKKQLDANGGELQITFTANKKGKYAANVVLTSDDLRIVVPVKAEAQFTFETKITASVQALDFGEFVYPNNIAPGDKKSLSASVTVVNPGEAEVLPSVIITGRDAAMFTVTDSFGQKGDNIEGSIEVTFTTTNKAGLFVAFVDIQHNGAHCSIPLTALVKSTQSVQDAPAGGCQVSTLPGMVIVETEERKPVAIFTLGGEQVYEGFVNGEQRIQVSAGHYLISVAQEIHKVVVQ